MFFSDDVHEPAFLGENYHTPSRTSSSSSYGAHSKPVRPRGHAVHPRPRRRGRGQIRTSDGDDVWRRTGVSLGEIKIDETILCFWKTYLYSVNREITSWINSKNKSIKISIEARKLKKTCEKFRGVGISQRLILLNLFQGFWIYRFFSSIDLPSKQESN